MNIKDEHTSRLWNFIMKGEIMAFELDDDEMIATRINNKAASWKEVEEYIEKYYVKKDKIKNKIEQLELFKKALPIRGTEIERFIGELKELLGE